MASEFERSNPESSRTPEEENKIYTRDTRLVCLDIFLYIIFSFIIEKHIDVGESSFFRLRYIFFLLLLIGFGVYIVLPSLAELPIKLISLHEYLFCCILLQSAIISYIQEEKYISLICMWIFYIFLLYQLSKPVFGLSQKKEEALTADILCVDKIEMLLDKVNELPVKDDINGRPHEKGDGGDIPKMFKDWIMMRKATIKALKEMIQRLNKAAVYCWYGKVTGPAVGIIGSVINLISLGTLPIVAAVQSFPFLCGVAMKMTGAIIPSVAIIRENIFTQFQLNEFEVILRKDQKLSEPLFQWLDYTRQLDQNLRKEFGIGLRSEIFDDLLAIYNETINFVLCESESVYPELLSRIQNLNLRNISELNPNNIINCYKIFLEKLKRCVKVNEFSLLRLKRNTFKRLKDLNKTSIVWGAKLSFKLFGNAPYITGLGIPVAEVLKHFLKDGALLTKACCTIEITMIILNSYELYNACNASSVSKYDKQLTTLKNQLKEELFKIKTHFCTS